MQSNVRHESTSSNKTGFLKWREQNSLLLDICMCVPCSSGSTASFCYVSAMHSDKALLSTLLTICHLCMTSYIYIYIECIRTYVQCIKVALVASQMVQPGPQQIWLKSIVLLYPLLY